MSMATGVDYNAVGDAAARAFPAKTSVMLVITGIQLFMFSFSVSVFCETPTGKRGKRWPYLLVSFIVFILFAASTSLDIVWKHDIIFNAKSGSDVMAAIAHDAPTQWSGRASVLTLLAYVTVSDGIMVFRCCVICRDKLWMYVPSIIAYLASIALGVRAFTGSELFINTLSGPWALSAVLVNVLTTSTIAFRLTRANNQLHNALPRRDVSIYTAVTHILVESALPPTIFGIFYAIMAIIVLHPDWSEQTTESAKTIYVLKIVSSSLYFSFVALSPQIIIFRVTTGRVVAQETAPAPRAFSPVTFANRRSEQVTGVVPVSLSDVGSYGMGEESDQHRPRATGFDLVKLSGL